MQQRTLKKTSLFDSFYNPPATSFFWFGLICLLSLVVSMASCHHPKASTKEKNKPSSPSKKCSEATNCSNTNKSDSPNDCINCNEPNITSFKGLPEPNALSFFKNGKPLLLMFTQTARTLSSGPSDILEAKGTTTTSNSNNNVFTFLYNNEKDTYTIQNNKDNKWLKSNGDGSFNTTTNNITQATIFSIHHLNLFGSVLLSQDGKQCLGNPTAGDVQWLPASVNTMRIKNNAVSYNQLCVLHATLAFDTLPGEAIFDSGLRTQTFYHIQQSDGSFAQTELNQPITTDQQVWSIQTAFEEDFYMIRNAYGNNCLYANTAINANILSVTSGKCNREDPNQLWYITGSQEQHNIEIINAQWSQRLDSNKNLGLTLSDIAKNSTYFNFLPTTTTLHKKQRGSILSAINQNTPLADTGAHLRGYALTLPPFESNLQKTTGIQKFGGNITHNYTEANAILLQEGLPVTTLIDTSKLDYEVLITRELGLYLLISGPTNTNNTLATWITIAPRYVKEKHVIYEINNEPSGVNYLKNQAEAYMLIHTINPKQHMVFLSYMSIPKSESDISSDINQLRKEVGVDLDWNNASIAVHGYNLDRINSYKTLSSFLSKAHPPIWMTEFQEVHLSGIMSLEHLFHLEHLGLSWINFTRTDDLLDDSPTSVNHCYVQSIIEYKASDINACAINASETSIKKGAFKKFWTQFNAAEVAAYSWVEGKSANCKKPGISCLQKAIIWKPEDSQWPWTLIKH